MEAHYPNEINEDNLEIWKQFARDTGIRLVTVVPSCSSTPSSSGARSPRPCPRCAPSAIERTIRTFELNRELDTDFAVVWPGIDGYENPFGIDLMPLRDRFATGLAEAMDAVPGVRVAVEPKPYEPRGHILYGTTAEGILLGQKVESHAAEPRQPQGCWPRATPWWA